MGRPTINDVATAAGVSKGAVSFALNGRPGISPDTRQPDPRDRRDARLVAEPPGPGAVGLQGARRRSGDRPPTRDPARRRVLPVVHRRPGDRALAPVGTRCCCRSPSTTTTRPTAGWCRRAASTACSSPTSQVDDERPALLEELGPARPSSSDPTSARQPRARQSALGVDDAPGIRAAVEHLVELGHTPDRARLRPAAHGARPLAPRGLERGAARRRACRRASASRPTSPPSPAPAPCATLLDLAEPPTAVVFANDLMAMAGLSLALSRGVVGARRPVGHRLRRHRDLRPPPARR